MFQKMVRFAIEITNVSQKKQRELSLSIKRARNLATYNESNIIRKLKKIGSIGEIIDVKRGFARNFLIANKKALMLRKKILKK